MLLLLGKFGVHLQAGVALVSEDGSKQFLGVLGHVNPSGLLVLEIN